MSKKLFSDAEIKRLRDLFKEFDADQSGNISPDEAKECLKKFGISLSDKQVSVLVEKVDSNHSGTIEFVEFMKFCNLALNTLPETEEEPKEKKSLKEEAEKNSPQDLLKSGSQTLLGKQTGSKPKKLFSDAEIKRLRDMFKEFDADQSGSISPDEAKECLKKLGFSLSDKQVLVLVEKVDSNHSGTIEFVEFMKFCNLALNTEPESEEELKVKKNLKEEAERKGLADDAEQKRLADEAEQKRLADEDEQKRLADEAERKRLAADEEEKNRLAAESDAEKERLANEAEKKRRAEAEENAVVRERGFHPDSSEKKESVGKKESVVKEESAKNDCKINLLILLVILVIVLQIINMLKSS